MSSIDELLLYISRYDDFVCYGAGRYGGYIIAFLKSRGLKPLYLVETHIELSSLRYDIPVISLDDHRLQKDFGIIVSVSNQYMDEMVKEAHKRGFKQIFCIDDELLKAITDDVISQNSVLRNKGQGKRCFILGTGPSIIHQDLSYLKDEIVLSCSWCSLFDTYHKIRPEIYVSPAVMNDPLDSESNREIYGNKKYEFLSKTITSPIVILDYRDIVFIEQGGYFSDKEVYYIHQEGFWTDDLKYCDLMGKTPNIQTATIMMLKIAIYMGFDSIYLIGAEHTIINRTYEHSYDIKKLIDMGYNELYEISKYHNRNVERKWTMRVLLKTAYNIFDEYYELHNVAKKQNIRIYNATEGGDLDEFERVKFESLFK